MTPDFSGRSGPADDGWPQGFHRLIAAQFCSALADNALLIVTIAVLQQRQMAPWLAPMLKFGMTLAYVLLAPFVGPLADAMPKARLMAWMNGLKMAGAAALLLGLHPVAAFVLVGCGAAAYAPAKYGLITELVAPRRLVAANGWIEVSVVGAVLLGTVLGGLLVADAWLNAAAMQALVASTGLAAGAAGGLQVSLGLLLAVYGLAGALNWRLPDSGSRYPASGLRPVALVGSFAHGFRLLWRDHLGGLSLAATTLFWGAGAVLQFIVLRWAHEQLGLPLAQAAMLQGVVAVGVVLGAAMAGRLVPLAAAPRMLALGLLMGAALPLLAICRSLWLAVPLLVAAGAVGGLMVVPLNALLQHRGCQLLSAGRSVAVQGFNEHLGILLTLSTYAAMVHLAVPLQPLMTGFGGVMALVVAGLMWRNWRQRRRAPAWRHHPATHAAALPAPQSTPHSVRP